MSDEQGEEHIVRTYGFCHTNYILVLQREGQSLLLNRRRGDEVLGEECSSELWVEVEWMPGGKKRLVCWGLGRCLETRLIQYGHTVKTSRLWECVNIQYLA